MREREREEILTFPRTLSMCSSSGSDSAVLSLSLPVSIFLSLHTLTFRLPASFLCYSLFLLIPLAVVQPDIWTHHIGAMIYYAVRKGRGRERERSRAPRMRIKLSVRPSTRP